MARIQVRGVTIRKFIVDHVDKHPADIAKLASEHFGVTRQAVSKHMNRLVAENAITKVGNTRASSYQLRPLTQWQKSYPIVAGLAEDVVWRQDVLPILGAMPENVSDIWHYGLSEMFNNAIDHSAGTTISVHVEQTAKTTQLVIDDNGVGIFRKLQSELGLLDERHAVLELAKGKLTTDPARHTGEGIFFTSRMFDDFEIVSGGVYFTHQFGAKEDWIIERSKVQSGTAVWMKLNNHTARTLRKVFDQFTSGDQYGFSKTIVPVKLAQYGDDKLISRSQAKRLLARVDRFKVVIFDFRGVESIGQAFADEIFRVFANEHRDVELMEVNSNADVKQMIQRARTVS